MSRSSQGHLAMLLFSALVAGSFALGVLAANELAPSALNAVRFWIATFVVGAAVMMTGGVQRKSLNAPWRYPLLALPFVIYFVLMFEGLKTAPAVSAAAVFTLTPIMSAVFGWMLLRQRTNARMFMALIIGGIGAIWVIFRADIAALLNFDVGRGEAIYFVGCIAHAIYTPLVAKMNRGERAVEFTFLTLVAGSILLTIWAAPELASANWSSLPTIVWMTILYTAIFASAATFTLLQFAALRLPSSKVMAYTYLTPTWVIAWMLVLGQPAPTAWVLPGVGLTIVALLMLLKDDARTA